MRIVVVCCDRVPVKLIGAYGSEWVETPNLDRLAADGVVFDSVFASHMKPRNCGAQVLKKVAENRPVVRIVDRSNRRLSQGGIVDPDEMTVDSFESLFAKAAEAWDENDDDLFLWIDVALAEAKWSPPPEWENRHREDDDSPEPLYDLKPGPVDPLDVERISSGWADRLTYFDSLLGAFVQSIDEGATVKAAIVFTAELGESLGEHGVVGAFGDLPHRERSQRPLIVRHPDGPRSVRRVRLTNSEDLDEMILGLSLDGSAAGLGPRSDSERWCVASRGAEKSALTTRHWKFVDRADGGSELFAIPEDHWEMNDLASRTPGTLDDLQMTLELLIDEVKRAEE